MSIFKRLVAGLTILSVFGAGCTKGPDAATVAASQPKTLKIWGVIDDGDVYADIIAAYRRIAPNVTIEYKRFRLEEYENQLLNSLAEDRGPDIFLIHNTWVGKYLPKIQPMPPSVKIATQHVEGTLQKEVVWSLQAEPTVSLKTFKEEFADVVSKDMIRTVDVSTKQGIKDFEPRVVAMPLSVDTMGLFVNKDLLNAAGISTIPQTWDIFQEAVKRLVKQDDQGTIVQAGAALGTGANIERSPDILAAIMMQNGAEMSNQDGAPTFANMPARFEGLRERPPADQAVEFYTDFANPGKDVYTWNRTMPNSLDAFVEGKVAFFFGYSFDLPIIQARAPKLNLGIAKFPQIKDNPEADIANYWAWTVSKKSKSVDAAWHFLNFMHKPENAKKFLTAAKRPAALRSLLPDQLEDEEIGVFASQVLTAQSWYRGNDPKATDDAFVALIESSIGAEPDKISQNLHNTANLVGQTISY